MYSGPTFSEIAEQAGNPIAVATELAAEAADASHHAPATADSPATDDVDYDLDYETDYDYSDCDYSDYDYSDYDYSDYDYSDYDYSDYDYSDYDDYESSDFNYRDDDVSASEDTGNEDTGNAVAEDTGNAAADGAGYDEFDNYDYEDYFAEIYGTVEAELEVADSAPAGEPAAVATPEVDAPVVVNDDVDAFDYFNQEAFAPATEAGSAVDNSGLYDLRTTYDDVYDSVMAPTVESPAVAPESVDSPAVEPREFGGTDHCFGGYSDGYRSEYRCDLADAYQDEAYQSFYHDGSDPSAAIVTDSPLESEDADATAADIAFMTALPLFVEPYVAIVVDRVGSAWQNFSLDVLVARAVTEVAKLPSALSRSAAEAPVRTPIANYVDCHADFGLCEPNWCEIDCFAPWEDACPTGSGAQRADAAAAQPADLDAELLDTAALEATKASIRDLRSRMNAARQSPPLR